MPMTPEQFLLLQTYLINVFWPFIEFWVMAFMVLVIVVAILIFFLSVTREFLARAY